ncbi:FkbM family methyltransferase [Tenacibaculum jejuense]|uniref:Methyltransferase FkbM domain-containing protein n=1 Tax=Tenacibaculum jejuense TaxID=584609 RepID=A0A238UGP4_9FLAO|nr:FkbM family methyltransferase [Tenacibaculum jejuense]SNR17698.1 protein of unknown function [Tenacibaculum jejuense]
MIKKKSFSEKIINKFKKLFDKESEKFLTDITGLIHVGANIGQECRLYKKYGLDVIWIEPIPEVFQQLKRNIKKFPNQKAIQALLTNKNDETYEFNIANNNGASSSILKLDKHQDLWPEVSYEKTLQLKSITLQKLVADELIDINKYQAIVLDTQGSELLVLQGSIALLKKIKYISTEVANFESYKNCCKLDDMILFMKSNGFIEVYRETFAESDHGEIYYEILFKNILM